MPLKICIEKGNFDVDLESLLGFPATDTKYGTLIHVDSFEDFREVYSKWSNFVTQNSSKSVTNVYYLSSNTFELNLV